MRSWAWTSELPIRKCTASSPTVLVADQTANPTAIMLDDLLNQRLEEPQLTKDKNTSRMALALTA